MLLLWSGIKQYTTTELQKSSSLSLVLVNLLVRSIKRLQIVQDKPKWRNGATTEGSLAVAKESSVPCSLVKNSIKVENICKKRRSLYAGSQQQAGRTADNFVLSLESFTCANLELGSPG